MTDAESEAFAFEGGRVEPGETEELRYSVSETYLRGSETGSSSPEHTRDGSERSSSIRIDSSR